MSAAPDISCKRDTLNIRIKPEERNLIDRAAKARGKSRTNFILDAARMAAEEALFAPVILVSDAQVFADFLVRLDRPQQSNPRLRKTMQAPAPWNADE